MRYNLLTYPISYKKNYPHPYSNGSMKRKKYTKMFPFCPRNPWSIQPYHMLAPAFLSTQACCRRTTPVYYGRRTTGKPKDITWQTNNVFTYRPIWSHILLRNYYIKLLIHYTLKTLFRRFPCGCNLNIVICNFIVA